jgi:soluble lytic murein transglycosylase-like protein
MRRNLTILSMAVVLEWGAFGSFQWTPLPPHNIDRPLPLPLLRPAWVVPVPPFDNLINDAARENHLDPLLLKAIISVESGFNPHSVSVTGACGLTQLMPATGKLFGIKNIFDPKENIQVGAHHFHNLLERFSQNLPLSLAAYNAGEAPVVKFHDVPPYPETQWYVRRVLAVYQSNRTTPEEISARKG